MKINFTWSRKYLSTSKFVFKCETKDFEWLYEIILMLLLISTRYIKIIINKYKIKIFLHLI